MGAEAIARALRTQSRYKHAPGSQHTGIEAIDLSANFLRSEVGAAVFSDFITRILRVLVGETHIGSTGSKLRM